MTILYKLMNGWKSFFSFCIVVVVVILIAVVALVKHTTKWNEFQFMSTTSYKQWRFSIWDACIFHICIHTFSNSLSLSLDTTLRFFYFTIASPRSIPFHVICLPIEIFMWMNEHCANVIQCNTMQCNGTWSSGLLASIYMGCGYLWFVFVFVFIVCIHPWNSSLPAFHVQLHATYLHRRTTCMPK